jgi:nicotinate-nucleotide adenylyltransferase
MVLAPDPWQKQDRVVASAADRWDLLVAATRDVEGLEASDIELRRSGPTYTIDTVEALAAPDRALVLILGADAAAGLDSWHRAADLAAAVEIAVVSRASDTAPALGPAWRCVPVHMPRLDISSTDIRRRIAAGEPIEFLVPPHAIPLLRERRLYTPDR